MLTIIPTLACNCRCPYCYELHSSLKTSQMSHEVVDNLKKYISTKAKNLSALGVGWFGGEPLLCLDIIEDISKYCIDLCEKENIIYNSQMTSNGVLLSKETAEILSKLRIHNIQITFDGSKENHDKTRVTSGGKPTFDIIYKNILDYLNINENNTITLRIHVNSNTSEEDIPSFIETLSVFDKNYRKRIIAYPHVIYAACSEEWAQECEVGGRPISSISTITNKIQDEANILGYLSCHRVSTEIKCACQAEIDGYWVVRPEGYLNKCTVGIEKERSQAKLTEKGIEFLPGRFFKTIKKEFSTKLYEQCQDCKYLPFCWQGCIFQHYQNPDIDNFIKFQCYKGKKNWLMERKINSYRTKYIEEKVKNENR